MNCMAMRGRQKVLLYLASRLKEQNRQISKTHLNKLLFVLCKESEMPNKVRFYNFYPYLYGPFSSQLYLDIADLQSRTYLDEKLNPKMNENEIVNLVGKKIAFMVDTVIERFLDDNILDYVYEKYPEYTVRSRLRSHEKIEKEPGLFSIGYEGHDIDSFLDVLIQNQIRLVADLRFNPFSMNAVFTKSRLLDYLKKAGIDYIHIPELGIDGKYRKNLNSNKDYQELFEFYSKKILPNQKEKIIDIAEKSSKSRVVMMCFEHDKDHCHRGIVSSELERDSFKVSHL